MKYAPIFYLGIVLFFGMISLSSSCFEEGEWLEFDEAQKKQSLVMRYLEDSTRMHLSPISSIQEYLKEGGVQAMKIRVVDSGGIKCDCSKRKNGNCLCKLPNNKRHECKTFDDNDNHVCVSEKYIRIFVEPMYVTQAKRLGFE